MRLYTIAAVSGMMLGAWLLTAGTASAVDVRMDAGNVILSDNTGPRGMDPRMAPPPPPKQRPGVQQPCPRDGRFYAPVPPHGDNGRGPRGQMAPPPKHYKYNNGKNPCPPQHDMRRNGYPPRP